MVKYIIKVRFNYGPYDTQAKVNAQIKRLKARKMSNLEITPVRKKGRKLVFSGILYYSAPDAKSKTENIKKIKKFAPNARVSVTTRR
jgi:hypothetical protein